MSGTRYVKITCKLCGYVVIAPEKYADKFMEDHLRETHNIKK